MKKVILWFSALTLLFWGQVANANGEIDLLNLDSYLEGDTPPYGEYVIVKQDEKTGIKWITGSELGSSGNMGRLKYSTQLSGDFELFIKADHGVMEVFLIANDEYKITLDFCASCADLKVGKDSAGNDQSGAWSISTNQIQLKVVNNVAKLYANEVFSKKINLQPDLTYTQLLVLLDRRDELYELKINSTSNNNTVTSVEPPTGTPTEFLGDCMASYSIEGQLHIPCVAVSNIFGDTTIYDVKMQQRSGQFTFDLDMNSIQTR